MAVWPHVETALSADERNAYRFLLYDAMLDIRTLCQSRGPASRNPLEWRRQYLRSRLAGCLADWLHNLARFAAADFAGFDADWFWQEYDHLVARASGKLGHGCWIDFRGRYSRRLDQMRQEAKFSDLQDSRPNPVVQATGNIPR